MQFEKNKTVSVIIPTYNREKTIIRAVNSVLNQTYHKIELIVVDDGSTDKTGEILSKVKDTRFRYIYQENRGACEARNRGVMEAKGEYVAFQDSDDEWYLDKLEKQMKYIERTSADIVFCAFYRDGIEKETEHIPDASIPSKKIEFNDLVPVNMMSTQTILGKRVCFIEEHFDTRYMRYQDWELAIRLVQRYKIYYDSEVLVHVYVGEDSISRKPELALDAIFGILKNTANYYCKVTSRDWKVIDRLEKQKAELEKKLEKQRSENEQLEKWNISIEEQIKEKELEINKLNASIDEYRNSIPWKLTVAFREFVRMINRRGGEE